MPLSWQFAHNLLIPGPRLRADVPRGTVHVRVFSDRWSGSVAVIGELRDSGIDFEAALPTVVGRITSEVLDGRPRLVTYRPSRPEPFHQLGDTDASVDRLVPCWPADKVPADATAYSTVVLQWGPVVDVWRPADYTTEALMHRRRPPVAS